MSITYYPLWQRNRIDFLCDKHADLFRNAATVVNMGAFQGDLGYLLQRRFPHLKVLNEEARRTHITRGREKYPDAEWLCVNYETCDLNLLSRADIVLNFGVLYHIRAARAEEFLHASIDRADAAVFLESVVLDCDDDPEYYIETVSSGHDQCTHGTEIKPSISWVESRICEDYVIHADAALNGDGHTYDWPVTNSRHYGHKSRKMWVITK